MQEPTAPAMRLDASHRRDVVENVNRELAARYVFPDKAARVAALLSDTLASQGYDDITDARLFAERLTRDAQSVTGDKHLRIRHQPTAQPQPAEVADPPLSEVLSTWRPIAEERNFGVERVERLPMNIGYIDLRAFEIVALAGDAITAAMSLVAHTRALIVDLRHCPGGDPATVALMSSYLFDERTHLNSIYQRVPDRTDQYWTQDWVPGKRFGQAKPLYVLTSSRTFSAAEEFSYNIQAHRRGTLVGETTRGGAHPGGWRWVSQHFEVFVPDGRSVSPITKGNWEGTGVVPDVKVPEADALKVAQVLALKALLPSADEAMRDSLGRRITELEGAGS